MQRRVFLLLAAILSVPAIASANLIGLQGGGNSIVLAPNTANQIITLTITGPDAYTDSSLFALVNGGSGPAPAFTAVFGDNAGSIASLAGSVWNNGGGGISSDPNGVRGGGSTGLDLFVGFQTPGGASQTTNGVYAILTVDTTGINGGDFLVDLGNTTLFNGLDEFLDPIPAPLQVGSFTISIPVVPEPSSIVLGLFAAAGLAAVAIRRRRNG